MSLCPMETPKMETRQPHLDVLCATNYGYRIEAITSHATATFFSNTHSAVFVVQHMCPFDHPAE
ncbi:unnamed protein product [Amoebophrya sp. A25]|nr:unnamed protein product [Amoebophrya sp. A25]|eukprot:GSA25T00005048001.1